MSTVEAYLRQQYAKEYSVPSMESGLAALFGRFDLPSLYTPSTIAKGPWNDNSRPDKFTVEFLTNACYKDVTKSFQTPIGSWLWQAGRALSFDEAMVSLKAELQTYQKLIAVAWPTICEYSDWAVRSTAMMETTPLDDLLACRPKTVAETVSGIKLCLIGMAERRPLTSSVPFRGDVLTTLKIQQRADHGAANYRLQLDSEKAIAFLELINEFDQLVSTVDDKFAYFHKTCESLKSFRELMRTDEEDHPIYRFLDREMMGVLNHDIHCAVFNRASSISNHLRMQIYCSTD
ncbi:hypothetical protein D9M68_20320 [compost metagenome]